MAAEPILNITQVAQDQANKYITINDAVQRLAAAGNDIHAITGIDTGPATISETEAVDHMVFSTAGGSADFDLEFPSTINSVNSQRVFMVQNLDATYACTVKASTGTGAEVVVAAASTAILMITHEDVYLIASAAAGGGTVPYDIGLYIPGLPADGTEVLKFVAVRDFDLADDFAGSRGHVGVNPTATAAFDVKKNGTSIGSISISTGGVLTFATTGGAASFTAGDYLQLVNPTPQDATLSGVGITFAGTRAA